MADDRPADDLIGMVAALKKELDDVKTTLMSRVSRRPTGDVEVTIRSTPKPDTLFLDGSIKNRIDFPVLWQWVQDNGLVVAGLFTNGNGTTTFGIPDCRGRVLLGSGTLGADTYALGATGGASAVALATANLPSHKHNVSLSQHEGHSHAIFNDGDHTGHFPGTSFTAAAGADLGLAAWNSGGNFRGVHDHGMSIEGQGKPHTVTESNIGSGTAFDNRQPYLSVNWMIWV